jgi:Uma2 family endonuclease
MQLADAGMFPGRRTELIDGEVLDVSSQNNPHIAGISKINRLLVAAFDESYWLMVQATLRLPSGDVPEPDFAIRPGPISTDNSVQPLPLLVIEVSDETLLFDQFMKSSLYAANAIADYWVVNVKDRQVEVYRDPVPDPSRRHGHRYSSINTFKPGTAISPLAAPHVRFEVEKMLP